MELEFLLVGFDSVEKLSVSCSQIGSEVQSTGGQQSHLRINYEMININQKLIPSPNYLFDMSEGQSQTQTDPITYQWVNRSEYEHNNIQEHGDSVTVMHSEQGQEQNVAKLFYHVMKKSKVTLLHLDDEKKQMRLFNLPKYGSSVFVKEDGFSYMTAYQNSRHRFSYMTSAEYNLGERGFGFNIVAHTRLFKQQCNFHWKTLFKNRLDSAFVCDLHQIGFTVIKRNIPWVDNASFTLGRQCRENYLSFYDKEAEKTYKFGAVQPDSELPKQSSICGFLYKIKKSFLTLNGIAGIDYGNRSYYKELGLLAEKTFQLSDSFKLYLAGRAVNLWGVNILKNDMMFPNKKKWMGGRTKNYTTASAELVFTKFPYLHLLNLNPYIYGQVWAIFNPEQNNGPLETKILGQYGLGLTSTDGRFKFSLSLFNCSSLRKEGSFGPIKFSF